MILPGSEQGKVRVFRLFCLNTGAVFISSVKSRSTEAVYHFQQAGIT